LRTIASRKYPNIPIAGTTAQKQTTNPGAIPVKFSRIFVRMIPVDPRIFGPRKTNIGPGLQTSTSNQHIRPAQQQTNGDAMTTHPFNFFAAILTISMLITQAAASDCLPADFDADADVDFTDYRQFQLCFTGPGAQPSPGCDEFDLDADSDVDLADYAAFESAVTGPAFALDYGPSPRPDAEAEQLALEEGLGLLASDDMYNRIQRDLAAIRQAEPAVATVIHDPAWGASQMIVKVLHGMDTCDYDALNAFYQVTNENFLFTSGGGDWYVIFFPGRMRIPLLANHYAALPEVEFADPDSLVGTDDRIEIAMLIDPPGAWRYTIDDGFHDCFDGCDCHVVRTFTVSADAEVTLDNLNCFGFDWCDLPQECNPD
jgi:hypothetical protein